MAKRLRRDAKRAGKSVSQYVVELATESPRPQRWPRGFVALYGSCEGELPEPDDALPEPVDLS